MNPYQVTRDFEAALCNYCGSPFAVAVNSCTAALQLAVEWWLRDWRLRTDNELPPPIEIPRHTYVSVPCAIIHAGARVAWRDENWSGAYQLKPLPVYDCARRFTSGMYGGNWNPWGDPLAPQPQGTILCVSFSTTKILGIEQGGAILHDSPTADTWLRKMRFDGRTEGVDQREDSFQIAGHHCIMLPSTAAQLTLKLYHLPRNNPDLPHYPYPDLSIHHAFR